MADGELLIYGSYGYTGSLVTRRAVDEGLEPVLAGRSAEAVERQATNLGLDHRVFSLEHPRVVKRQVGDAGAVLNCAGPFEETARPMYEACLDAGTDYLDIAADVEVLEDIAERDREAEKAGVSLLPAVGFDVVPTDCLAAALHTELLSATRLTLAIDGVRTYSPGTVRSIVGSLDRPGMVRESGSLRTVPAAWKTRRIDFGEGEKPAVTVPWGDVSTAYYATGIPNIETYAAAPEFVIGAIRRTRPLAPVFQSRPFRRALRAVAGAVVSGPSAAERAGNEVRVWGEVEDDDGERVSARLRTPDVYDVTAMTAVESARRTLAGDVEAGFQTPASAFGPEFALEFEGIVREEEGAVPRATASAGAG